MTLAALQQDFRGWLTTGSGEASSRFAPDAQAGLQVYQNNYRAALMACLEDSFPRTLAWIGSDGFRSAAARHIDDCPPDSWSLDHYASHFPAALAEACPDDPEVAELAALELALADAFVGRDAEPMDAACLPDIDWDHAVLRWVPGSRLLPMLTNAPAIWSALAAEVEPPAAAMYPEPATVMIWRQAETSCFRLLDPLEAHIAPGLFDGMGFAEICARLVTDLGEREGVQASGTWLGRWVADGLLAALTDGTNHCCRSRT